MAWSSGQGEAAKPGETPKPPRPAPADATWTRTVLADPVLLFRFSALTYNAHRIHYDRDYAMKTEGYPGLVVHGPFVALSLLEAARKRAPGRTIARFAFRSAAPLFDTSPFLACGRFEENGATLWAESEAHGLAMQATVTFAAT